MSRKVTLAMKKQIAGRQYFTCNNKPNSNLLGLENYECPLWSSSKKNAGNFDESGYEIDHIVEWSVTKNDDLNNLQALCPTCHKVKTKRFLMDKNKKSKKKNTSEYIDDSPTDLLPVIDPYLENMNLKQLRQICLMFNISSTGSKECLINKIISKEINISKLKNEINENTNKKYFMICKESHQYYTNNDLLTVCVLCEGICSLKINEFYKKNAVVEVDTFNQENSDEKSADLAYNAEKARDYIDREYGYTRSYNEDLSRLNKLKNPYKWLADKRAEDEIIIEKISKIWSDEYNYYYSRGYSEKQCKKYADEIARDMRKKYNR